MSLTWENTIKDYFSNLDIQHMKQYGINLGDHKNVKDRSGDIYSMVQSKRMPPPPREKGDGPWEQKKIENFGIWMKAGCP